jgi:uncharacterized protein (UPF0276 family)
MMATREFLGFGLGLRKEHYQTILDEKPAVDWFEIISENYMVPGGRALHNLDRIREYYPLVMHGVSLSIGSTDPLNIDYLKELKKLIQRVQPKWVSDHLCWTGNAHLNMHDLLPLPYNEHTIQHVVERIKQVQDFLNRQLVIENLSSYLTYTNSDMSEWEFVGEIAQRSDSLILLDVNNVYVSSRNHHFDPLDYIKGLPQNRIQQIHLAGHRDLGDYVIDTHDEPIRDEVWALYQQTARMMRPVPTMIERDDDIPELSVLLQELDYAREIGERVWREAAA